MKTMKIQQALLVAALALCGVLFVTASDGLALTPTIHSKEVV